MPKVTGADKASARLRGMAGQRLIEQVGQALFAGGEIIRAEAHRSISEGSVSGKRHVPSLPGEPPNRDTGVLQAHIETTQPAPLRVEVSSNAPYASYLEFGTSRMAPRPYMRPASRAKKEEVVALVRKAANAAIKAAKR